MLEISQRSSTAMSMEMDRRAAFGQIAAAGAAIAAMPSVANADGAISGASINRARGLYGDRIAALDAAVAKGDFAAVAAEKNAFILFNSGAYPRVKDKADKAVAIDGTNKIFAAIRSKDAGALKAAYGDYVKANDVKPLPTVDAATGQGYSNDYDFRVRSKAG